MISTLTISNWIKLSPASTPSYYFNGSLLKINSGLSSIKNPLNSSETIDLSSYSYIKLNYLSTFLLKILQKKSKENKTEWDFLSNFRSLFSSLHFAGIFYLTFELISIVSVAVLMFTSAVALYRTTFYFKVSLVSIVSLWISHIAAVIGYIGSVEPTFLNNCTDNFYDSLPSVCATDGPKLAVFVLIILPFVTVPYLFCLFYFKEELEKLQDTNFTFMSEANNTAIITKDVIKINKII